MKLVIKSDCSLIDVLSHTEAESRMNEEMATYTSEELKHYDKSG
jgi:hypothetical protein